MWGKVKKQTERPSESSVLRICMFLSEQLKIEEGSLFEDQPLLAALVPACQEGHATHA